MRRTTMEIKPGGFNPEMDAIKVKEARVEAKVTGIKGNPGEARTDEEIRAQALAEIEAEEAQH